MQPNTKWQLLEPLKKIHHLRRPSCVLLAILSFAIHLPVHQIAQCSKYRNDAEHRQANRET